MLFDLDPDQLRDYRPPRDEPDDFDEFWAGTLDEAATFDLEPVFEPVHNRLRTVRTFDLSFRGYGGHRVHAWLQLPAGIPGPLPCVIEYIGYTGGRGLPHDRLMWSAAGYAQLVVDTRGQGTDTADPAVDDAPHVSGFLTRGALDPHTYYYRRVYTDAVRAIEAAGTHPDIDARRMLLTGGSQGGGIALAASALAAGRDGGITALMADVPFLCHFRRAVLLTDNDPYIEIARYCRRHPDHEQRLFATLGYFDGMQFAARAHAPALFSVALMDDICPPSTVYAAYNHYAGRKELTVWPYAGHEGGEGHQKAIQLDFADDILTGRERV